jgi:transglutaminase-like putative cysteine protease
MRKAVSGFLGFILLVVAAAAAEPRGKMFEETWEAAFLDNTKVGFVHTTVHQVESDSQKVLKTLKVLDLKVNRFKDTVSLRSETGSDETAEGKVTGVFLRYYLAKDQQMVVRGTVEGDHLHVKGSGGGTGQAGLDKKIPWDDHVVGLYRQDHLFKEKNVHPKDQFSFRSYQPELTHVVTTRVTVKDYEEVDVLGPKGAKTKQRLLRVEAVADKVAGIQLPALTVWLDQERQPVRTQMEIPGLGNITLYRTTRETATKAGGAIDKDIGISQLIRLKGRLPRGLFTESAVYRITVTGDDDPRTLFAQDVRQQVKNVKKNSIELHVRAQGHSGVVPGPGDVKAEYLKSCYFINCDDARVKSYAREAAGTATEPWKKALRIERWVHDNMQNKNFTEAFATADHVAKTLEGDCTEHAVLAAAMCRAVGVPSRTAIGLVYLEKGGVPYMGFHMWAEVWVNGIWTPIDATLGRGYVGAGHLKISDHSWYETQSLTPLLPTVRVLTGKIAIEVLSARGEE